MRVSSVEEGIRHLSEGNARLHAGGTDLLGCFRDHILRGEKLVSISGIRELKGIREERGGLRIGALTTVAEVAQSPLIRKLYPGLAQAALEVGSPQLRAQGTIGGNICQKPRCWYYRGDFHCIREAIYVTPLAEKTHIIVSSGLPAVSFTPLTLPLPYRPSRQR